MLLDLQKKLFAVLFTLCVSVMPLSAKDDHNLTDIQLHSVMGIITNFILSSDVYVPDTIAPVFTSSAIVTVAENQTSAISVVATDAGSSVTYSITGEDSIAFSIGSNTGVITFNTAPDFEGVDTYVFTVIATDTAGNVASQSVTIHISDVLEGQSPKKTGQTKSYNTSGTEITDSSIKDDGHYQKGTIPSYTRDDNTNIVTDHITGLQWADDVSVSSVRKKWITQANYDAGNYEDTSGDTAATYCTNVTLGGFNDWRLPTRKELVSLVDYGYISPAISPVLQNVASNCYWSSTTCADYTGWAWFVYFDIGSQNSYFKTNSYYVRCVRVGE